MFVNNHAEAIAELIFMPFDYYWYENYNPLSFSPLSHGVDLLTDKAMGAGKHVVQCLNYFVRPIDDIIIAIAALCFEAYKHFHGIIKCTKTNRVGQAILRIVFSPITLPCRLVGKFAIVAINRTVAGCIDILIPYKAIHDIIKPQERAEKRMQTRALEHSAFFQCPVPGVRSYVFSRQSTSSVFVNREKQLLYQTFWM